MRVAAIQSWDLFLWVSQHAITLEATHNTRADADALSRQWQLSSQVVDRCRIYPGVDLFASLANNHVLQPVSSPPSAARGMPCHSLGGDASSTFPPPARLTRVLLKIELDGAFSILLTAPCWPSRAWFPKLVRSLTGQPLRLPPAFQTDRTYFSFTGSPSSRRDFFVSPRPRLTVPRPWLFGPYQGVLNQGGAFGGSCPYGGTGTSSFHPQPF